VVETVTVVFVRVTAPVLRSVTWRLPNSPLSRMPSSSHEPMSSLTAAETYCSAPPHW
jgi:hypothetical protein